VLTASKVLPAGVDVFWWQVVVGLDRMTKEGCDNVFKTMPRRIEAVIKAKGAQTKY
jgi:hypothetical protein